MYGKKWRKHWWLLLIPLVNGIYVAALIIDAIRGEEERA